METARSSLLVPASTAAVVLGAHDWTDAGLERAPSFWRSASHLVAYLYDRAGLGLDPELILNLFDDTAGAGDQLARVNDTLGTLLRERRDTGRPVTDVLVYYIGHGYTDDQGHLSLLVRRSRRGMEAATAIKAPDLRDTLRRAAPQQRRIVILDCCFSEAAARAFFGMGDLNQQVAAVALKDLGDKNPKRGTLLLCSCPASQIAVGPPMAQRTLFTGAVLEVLQQGVEGHPPYLSFADLRDAARDRMVEGFGPNAPYPVLHQTDAFEGDLTRAPAFPNRAVAAREGERQFAKELGQAADSRPNGVQLPPKPATRETERQPGKLPSDFLERMSEEIMGSASKLLPPDLTVPPSRPTEAPAPLGGPAPDLRRDGWLSDLLKKADDTKASRDTWLSDLLNQADGSNANREKLPPRRGRHAQPAAVSNPLESLSLDIGRLMDRTLAAEMWDRYQRGESKAFTKRLYTAAGQKAFDEVARKYRGPQALRNQLTSENGLVYTLLAHAMGRLA